MVDHQSNRVPAAVGLQATLLASWVQIAYRTAQYNGLNADEVFAHADINVNLLNTPQARIPAHKVKTVWDQSARLTGDAAYPLTAAKSAHPGMYHSLGIILSSSQSLKEAFRSLMRYRRIVDTMTVNELHETQKYLIFTWTPINKYESDLGGEAFVVCLLQLLRWSLGENFSPARVTLQRKASNCRTKYERFFKSDVAFNSTQNALYFCQEDASKLLPTSNKAIRIKMEQLSSDYLARILRGDTVNKVHSLILTAIEKQHCCLDRIAKDMGLSRRTLQRKLKIAGTSYETLLDEILCELALQYIIDLNVSIKEVGLSLGFSDASNFGSTFKRWTGLSPGQYRKQHTTLPKAI